MVFLIIEMPSDNEFDYMSDSFLAEWLVLYDISHHVYVKFGTSFCEVIQQRNE